MAKRPELKHVKFVEAKGRLYAYFDTGKKVNGRPVRNPLPRFGSDGFFEAYAAQLAHRNRRPEEVLTIERLADRYRDSEEWKALSNGSRQLYGLTLNRICAQLGKLTAEKVDRAHVREVLNNRITGNGARNIFLAVGKLRRRGCPTSAFASHRRSSGQCSRAGGIGFEVVPHGLRKSAVHALLLAGCSTDEVMAITGQSRNMVDYYAKKISQHQLGEAAILKLKRKQTGQTPGKTSGISQ